MSKLGFKVIDDSYNSNTEGFKAALFELTKIKGGKKIVVSPGILELGEEKDNTYSKLAVEIGKSADVLLTGDRKLAESIRRAKEDFFVILDNGTKKQLDFLKNSVKKGDIVLFEGPNAALMREIL